MNVDIVSCVFCPEPIVSARTSADLADRLAQNGHRVRVLAAFPNRPAGHVFEGYRRSLWSWDHSFSKFEVLRLFSFLSPKSGVVSRFLENISFGLTSAMAVLFLDKPDVIYGNVWPIFAQGLLSLVCHLRGIPLVLSVQDIYPESLSAQSRIAKRRNWLFRLLRWIDLKTKQGSAAVVVISERFADIYIRERGIPATKVHIIPNWIDGKQVWLEPKESNVRARHGIPEDAFVVMYAGNVATASGLDEVIKAFHGLAENRDIYLLIAGSGSKLQDWQALAEKMDNPRVLFHTPWLDSETSCMLAAADLFILPTCGDQSLVSVPSKLISYMLAARPILCCAAEDSDIARVIAKAGCGWIIPAGNPDVITRMLLALSKEPPQELRRFGEQGRNYALRHMTRSANLPRLVDLIERVGCAVRPLSSGRTASREGTG